MVNKFFIFIFVFTLSINISGCSIDGVKDDKSEIINDTTFIDDRGNKFVVEKPYKKIITMYSAHTENLFSIGAKDSVIGVNSTSIYPPKAAFLPRYDYKSDPEPLIAAQPDLVIIRPFINRNYPNYIKSLKTAGLTVVSLYPATNNDFEKYINILAMITGKQKEAIIELNKLQKRLANIQDKLKNIPISDKPTVFFESTKTNYRTVTIDSNPAKAISLAGGINLTKDVKPLEKYSTIADFGIENIMLNADDIDVYISQRGAMNSGGSIISIPQREGFKAIKAVKENRILELNEKIISSPTFRYYKGVNELARMFHPEIMDDYTIYKTDELLTRENYAIITTMIDHSPIFVPSSSHYYEHNYYNHTYGLFEDISWEYKNFDYIETAVTNSFIQGIKRDDGIEYFNKYGFITREDLAFTLYMMGDFKATESNTNIVDLDICKNKKIVQKTIDNKLMTLDKNSKFNPNEKITGKIAIETLAKLKYP